MKCKKCGSDTLIKTGDWYECASCGALTFDTSIRVGSIKSPTKALETLENGGEISDFLTAGEEQKKSDFHLSFEAEKKQKSDEDIKAPADAPDNAVSYDDEKESVADESEKATENSKPKQKKESRLLRKSKKAAKKAESKEDENNWDTGKKPSKLKEGIQFCTPIVVALVIAILLKMFVFANAKVPTGSMLNTIQEGDRIVASRLAYINNEPERYDIIIFKYPDDESQLYVKRIIGMPGETVNIVDGVVYVTDTDGNTQKLEDDFITNCEPTGDFGPYTVPLESYFVMGDNRNNSWDSRYWDNKFVAKDKIIGKVKFRYYPSFGKIE